MAGILPDSKKRRIVHAVDNLYIIVKEKISEGFFLFGVMVGRHPVWFSVVPLIVSLLLGLGTLMLKTNNDSERLFTPSNSRFYKDRDILRDNFPDSTTWNFDAFGLSEVPTMAVILFRRGGRDKVTTDSYEAAKVESQQEKYNLLDPKPLEFVREVLRRIKNIRIRYKGKNYTATDLCARRLGQCATDGEYYTTPAFADEVEKGKVKYPSYQSPFGPTDLSFNLAGVKATPDGFMTAARVLKIRFFWRVDRAKAAKMWNAKFLRLIRKIQDQDTPTHDVTLAYSTSESLEEELEKGTKGDAVYFACTLIIMSVYSIFVSSGGDAVSTRGLLACGGVLAAALGIVASMGFLSLCQVEYVNFVGIMPYLIMGIGVDDMFLLMSAWGESFNYEVSTPERVGLTFSKAGIGITITSLTDFFAFLIGMSSTFLAVKQFCIFTAVAVLMVYIINCTLFGACMSLHGDRVYAGKHTLTCQPTKPRQQLRDEGAGICTVYCCGGSVPKENFEDESMCEKAPRWFLPQLVLNPITKVMVLLAFLAYVGAAIYGAIQLKPGMKYVDLVLRSSYYYKYSTWDHEYYGQRLAIAYVVHEEIDYSGKYGDKFRKVINEAHRDPNINGTFLRCWLHQYSRSPFYPPPEDEHDKEKFMQGLNKYLQYDKLSQNDIRMDETNSSVLASRCFVLTVNDDSIFKQGEMMLRMRAIADAVKEFKTFTFQPVFVMLEHTTAVVPATLQTVGVAVAVMTIVTAMMLPQLLMVALVTLNIIFIITCVFGFMHYLGLTFSGMSMIHILMSIGFSVDFSAHICAAYLMCDEPSRHDRANYALVHAAGPIFNGGLSSLVGVAMLMLSESYFFITFFKIMAMVIITGIICSVFFMPIVLSYIGPENPMDHHSRRHSSLIPNLPPHNQSPVRSFDKGDACPFGPAAGPKPADLPPACDMTPASIGDEDNTSRAQKGEGEGETDQTTGEEPSKSETGQTADQLEV